MDNKEARRLKYGLLTTGFLIIFTVIVTLLVVNSSEPSNVSNDGWANYIGGLSGSFIATFVSFVILYLNNKDTIEREEINRKFQEDNMKASNYSSIKFTDVLSIYKESDEKYRLKFKLKDDKNLPLKSIKIDNIHLLFSDKQYSAYPEENVDNLIYSGGEFVNLEYTPEQVVNGVKKEDFYYANFYINRNIEEMLKCEYYKLTIEMQTINLFGVSVKQKYYLMVKCSSSEKYAIGRKPTFCRNTDGFCTYLPVFHQFTNFDSIVYDADTYMRSV